MRAMALFHLGRHTEAASDWQRAVECGLPQVMLAAACACSTAACACSKAACACSTADRGECGLPQGVAALIAAHTAQCEAAISISKTKTKRKTPTKKKMAAISPSQMRRGVAHVKPATAGRQGFSSRSITGKGGSKRASPGGKPKARLLPPVRKPGRERGSVSVGGVASAKAAAARRAKKKPQHEPVGFGSSNVRKI